MFTSCVDYVQCISFKDGKYQFYYKITRDIQRYIQQTYGVEVSAETISNITESVMADVWEWQSRLLEKSYPILFFDALHLNSRQDGKNGNKALYVALEINWEDKKRDSGL